MQWDQSHCSQFKSTRKGGETHWNKLRVENKKLHFTLDELNQYQWANNLELKGVPLEGNP